MNLKLACWRVGVEYVYAGEVCTLQRTMVRCAHMHGTVYVYTGEV